MKFLAPPPRGRSTTRSRATANRSSTRLVARRATCRCCQTGPNANPLFDRQAVPLFSDLLLHDIGTGDGIPQASALPKEIRTPALWGLRVRRPLLHDGSASDVEDAIARHRGEAEGVRASVRAADAPTQRAALLAFLNSLSEPFSAPCKRRLPSGSIQLDQQLRCRACADRDAGAPCRAAETHRVGGGVARLSTSIGWPGFSSLLSMKRRKAGSWSAMRVTAAACRVGQVSRLSRWRA